MRLTISSDTLTRVLDTGTNLFLQASNDLTVNSAVIVDNFSGDGGNLGTSKNPGQSARDLIHCA